MIPALVIHGGAGALPESGRDDIRKGCALALRAGWAVLKAGGAALDAVCAAVVVLEDDPLFNAGVGSALTADGTIEMDASVMDGSGLRAGAVALLTRVRNPVGLARAVLEDGQHVLLAGEGAERFAVQRGVVLCAPEALVTARQRERWSAGPGPDGTVGAVAVDYRGHVAAATSTGGRFGKRAGRIGDSAVIGAGTYADNSAGAASATGNGDAILRIGLTRAVIDGLRDGRDPQSVAAEQLTRLQQHTGASGGVIVVDPLGRIGFAHNTPFMSGGSMDASKAEPAICS